jgi:hypothetical protein
MVCIIDDRDDVWEYAKNLICVKPYVYFKNIGDINEPTSKFLMKNKHEQHQNKEKTNETNDNIEIKAATSQTEEIHVVDNNKENEEQQQMIKADSTSSNACSSTENQDDYLIYLENILQKIHDEYYRQYDDKIDEFELSDGEDDEIDESNLPDMKIVLPRLREKVLKNSVITFSGVVPTDYDLMKQKCYVMATSLGAKVNKELKFNYSTNENQDLETTHLVAANYGTSKVHDALKMISSNKTKKQLFIVQPEWLIECYHKWDNCDEKEFALTKDYEYKNCLFHQEYNFYQQRRSHKQQISNASIKQESPKRPSTQQYKETKKKQKSSHFTPENSNTAKSTLFDDDSNSRVTQDDDFNSNDFNFTISNNELDKMDKEVDEECSNSDIESVKKSEHSLSSSSTSSSSKSLSDSSSSTSLSDDGDESGSLDDEMVKAIERDLN